ncbi:MAG: hypothetical protein MUF04_06795 [Akkermansiaceae bacterium]|jgi:uncharacterized repeat protein (TIGR04138 family)|nr:hypothetical protein [Akkermansiaceae bacterium]
MQPFLFEQAVAAIIMRDKRYAPHAYYFLKDALDFTLRRVAESSGGAPRHVSGPELLDGFRDLALQEFGPMAATLMTEWGVRQCPDVGEMVFNLIDEQVFGKQESDCREDFKGSWDLDDALRLPFLPTRMLAEKLRPGKPAHRPAKR